MKHLDKVLAGVLLGAIVLFTIWYVMKTPIPKGCTLWFDGCNTCSVGKDGVICTTMGCEKNETPYCIEYK